MSIRSEYRSIEGSVVLPNCDESVKEDGLRPEHLFGKDTEQSVPCLKILSARIVWCLCYNNLGADWGYYTFPQSQRDPNRPPISIFGIERFHGFIEFKYELTALLLWKTHAEPQSPFNSVDAQSARFLVNYTPRSNLWHNLESAKYELPKRYATQGPDGFRLLMLHEDKVKGKVLFDPTSLKDKCVGEISECIISKWQGSEEGKKVFHMPWLKFCLKIKDLTWNTQIQDLFFRHRLVEWLQLEVTGQTTKEQIQQSIDSGEPHDLFLA